MKFVSLCALALVGLVLPHSTEAAHPITVTAMEQTPNNAPGPRIAGAIVIVSNANTGQNLVATTTNANGVATVMVNTGARIKIRVVKGGQNGYQPAERIYLVPAYNANVNILLSRAAAPAPLRTLRVMVYEMRRGRRVPVAGATVILRTPSGRALVRTRTSRSGFAVVRARVGQQVNLLIPASSRFRMYSRTFTFPRGARLLTVRLARN